MFTGLIQQVGTLAGIARRGNGARLTVGHAPWVDGPLTPGESVAVHGVCLTVTVARADSFECDVLRETLDRTSLVAIGGGSRLNLERALRPSDRIGGHFVTGHVDGTGTVSAVKKESEDRLVMVSCGSDLLAGICVKGSVACDGVSLTVTEVTAVGFGVRLIPFTWDNTSLSELRVGGAVNIETDILEKYVRRQFDLGKGGSVTMERLKDAGFV